MKDADARTPPANFFSPGACLHYIFEQKPVTSFSVRKHSTQKGLIFMPKTHTLPETGFLRLAQVLDFIPLGRTAWYEGVKRGEYPAPVALGKRAKGYRAEDIRNLIARINGGEGENE